MKKTIWFAFALTLCAAFSLACGGKGQGSGNGKEPGGKSAPPAASAQTGRPVQDESPPPVPAPAPPAQTDAAQGEPYQLLPAGAQLPAVLPAGVTTLKSVRERPADFTGKEVTVLGVVAEAIYGGDMKDCAFAFKVSDGTSEAWVLPLSKTTPDLGKAARLRATVLRGPDRPWAPGRADAFYLQVKEWSYEGP